MQFGVDPIILSLNSMDPSISTMTGKMKIKVVFLGGQSVGKSSIIEKYIHDRFEETANPTVGIDFLAKNISHKGRTYRLQLWDTAGQQRFRSLIPSYLKDANCALIVFDVTSKDSLLQIEMWANIFNENKNGEGFIFFVGNKIDLQNREVTEEEMKQLFAKMGSPYFQISAKTGQNVQELFLKLVDCITDRPAASPRKKAVPTGIAAKTQNEKSLGFAEDSNINIAVIKPQQIANNNMVLKNQKIGTKNEGKHKGCC